MIRGLSALWFLLLPAPLTGETLHETLAVCTSCHGANGVSQNPLVPTIAGQTYTVIDDSLRAFREGRRPCAQSAYPDAAVGALVALMCERVADLADGEIAQLAAHFEQQRFEPAPQTFDAGLARDGRQIHEESDCERCHSGGGSRHNKLAALLAGQWSPYLRRSLIRIRDGQRKGPVEMNRTIADLEDREIEALVHFYASRGVASLPD